MLGSQILIESLKAQGVEIVFGIPGGVVLPIFDALYDSGLKVVLTRHEQGAAHAADGYARVTGKVGVCISTSGPGATNLVTGLANAHMDSVPMVAICGQVNTFLIGRDSFQEADITGITMPITKHNYLVKSPGDLPRIIKEAFYIASTGRPGPVLIDIPADISTAEIKKKRLEDEIDLKGYKPTIIGHKKQISSAVNEIEKAKRPLLYIGGGVIIAGAHGELFELANKLNCPVAHTLMGKGAFPETHPLSLGMLGMHGTWTANTAISNADLIIAVGVRFDDRVTGNLDKFAVNSKIIHVDIDPAEIGKIVPVTIPIVGDSRNVLRSIIDSIASPPKTAEWLKTIEQWRAEHPLDYDRETSKLLPQYIVEKIYELTRGEAIITTEVGQNQMWASQYYKIDRPRRFLSSGGLGTMGYGFPAAIGAQLGAPDELVIDIAGDGSFMMNIQELATAVCNKLPVKVAVLNNGYLGMVRQWQKMFYGGRYSCSCLNGNPEFAAVAEAFGAVGITVREKSEVEPAVKEAISNGKTTVIDFKVESEENVMPMVPKGAALGEMIEFYEEK
ncbi:MAG TPA: biosynthetic-type acetolactate synthase large subunit [bacterium]|nr:biosynthetic-type acetolactate synthase large subunit [bacterium]